jgi:hypothetical protein
MHRLLLSRLAILFGLTFVGTAALMSMPGLVPAASASGYCIEAGVGNSGVTVCTP